MARFDEYYPNYGKLYPGVELTPEVLDCLRKSDRKMKYAEVDLKAEQFVQDIEAGEIRFIPSREDSFDRLLDEDWQFAQDEQSPESIAISKDELCRLRACLTQLTNYEIRLVHALYFEGLSERQFSAATGTPQKTINDWRRKVLAKLKKMMDK